uniref:Uncharacterized protein n=1 Tax=Panagrolaimus davidi TaxID=227884 RepID=A0A914QAA2_9BILA
MTEKCLITLIKESSTPGELQILTIEEESLNQVPQFCFELSINDVSIFLKDIPNFMKIYVKSVILQVMDFEHPDFPTNVHFRLALAKELKKHKIPFLFNNAEGFVITKLLVAANIECCSGEMILIVLIAEDYVVVREIYRIQSSYYCPNVEQKRIFNCPKGYNLEKAKLEIFKNSNPKKIILAALYPYSKSIMKDMRNTVLKSKKLIVNESVSCFDEHRALVEMAKRLKDKSWNKFYVIPRINTSFIVDNAKNIGDYAELDWDSTKDLPFVITSISPRSHHKYYIASSDKDHQDYKILRKYSLPEGPYHKIKLTLTVDSYFFPSLTQEAYIEPEIEQLPKILTEKMDSKIPVIGFFDNSSIICFWNEKEKCYNFLEKWNGLYGEDLYISFDKEKPRYRIKAAKALKKNPDYVIYHLLRILSSPPSNLHINTNWSFKIKNDLENLILIEYKTFDGELQSNTPEFLMALLLKEHIKAIKEEIGEKPAEIGFVFFDKDNKYLCKDYSLLKMKIKESCDLLKIGSTVVEI